MKITAALVLLLTVAVRGSSVRRLNRHGKSIKDAESSGGSKSGKSVTTKLQVEPVIDSGKSGKSNNDDDASMSMNAHAGKSDKSADRPIAILADGKSGKAGELEASMSLPHGNKADKPLSSFFVETSGSSGKAGKSELETVHIETTTITYVGVEDVEMVKPKSGKADYGYSAKADKPSGGIATSKSDKEVSSPVSSSSSSSSLSKASKNEEAEPSSAHHDFIQNSTMTPSIAPLDSNAPTALSTTQTETVSTPQASATTVAASSSTTAQSILSTTFVNNGEPPTDDALLTLAPTPSSGLQPRTNTDNFPSITPTYYPTSYINDTNQQLSSNSAVESSIAIHPFALNLQTNDSINTQTVLSVASEHLIHSFRNYNKEYTISRLKLMILQDPNNSNGRYLEVNKMYLGGIVYSQGGVTPTPNDVDVILSESFSGARLDYFVNLLKEAGVHAVVSFTLENGSSSQEETTSGEKWKTASVGLAGAIGGLALVATGVHVVRRKNLGSVLLREEDIENGRFVIKLKGDDDEVEEFPGMNTVAETLTENDSSTIDDRSVPSAIGEENEAGVLTCSKSLDAIEQETYDPRISPLEEPPTTTRYVSLFTVKKDVKGKTMEEIDLRALAINYLSKMLKKFPNTFLLPYDKDDSTLPPITSIRGIPDDMEELERYVGNARVDEESGKVMFNLRVESDMPVSQMRSKKGSGAAPSLQQQKQAANVVDTSEVDNQEMDGSAKGFEDITI